MAKRYLARRDQYVKLGTMSLAIASAFAAQAAHAQASEGTIETIVVNAQRRSEEMQKVPIAITTFSAKDLELKQIRRLDDIKLDVPNVVIEPNTGTSSAAKIFMRGVGTDESLFTADPSVAIYIDDTYIARQTGAMFDMLDLQQVEVLRGPQGTLYGRNATGGAIRYVTKKPSGESRLLVDARVGNFGRTDVSVTGGGKLGEDLPMSFAVMSKNRDGYLNDITNGRKVNDEDVLGARFNLGANFGSNTTARLALDHVRQRSGPTYASGVLDPGLAAATRRPVNNPDGDIRTLETNLVNGKNDLDQTGVALTTVTDLGSFEWKNVLAHRKMDNLLYIDLDATTATRFHLYQDQSQKQTSYESQFTSQGAGPLSWTGGLFVINEKNRQPTRQDIFTTGGMITVAQTTNAWALYGQADWRFNPVWKATAGLRYSHETKDFSIDALKASGAPDFTFQKSKTWTRTDYKLGLDGQVQQNVLVYASATTGFKSGGFNGRATTAAAADLALEPETVLTYEVGFKSTLMGGRMRLNANYFRNDYKDLQLTAFDANGRSALFNATSALVQGYEFDAAMQITNRWQANLNIGTLDGRYKDYSTANAAIFADKKLKQAPHIQVGFGTSYRQPMTDGTLVLSAGAKHVGDHYQNLSNSELIKTKAYTTVDARAAWEATGGRWVSSFWVKNLTDKRYVTGGFDIPGLGVATVYPSLPRTYGVDLRYRFY